MIRIALLLLVVATGCKIRNEQSCEIADNQNNPECNDALTACTDSAQCAPDVCDTTAGICVECLTNADCEGQVCNASQTCEPCDTHADCDSRACDFTTGTCFDSSMVAYVAAKGPGTGAAGCTIDAACPTLEEALLASKPIIKAEGADKIVVDNEQTIDAPVRILADPGVVLTRSSDGPCVRVSNVAVAIEDLEISDGGSDTGDAIVLEGTSGKLTLDRVLLVENQGHGINSTQGELVMRRSIVAFNDQGGLVIAGKFAITNSLIVLNGTTSSQTGGMRVSSENPGSIFNFNTVANNVTDANNAGQGAVNCDQGGFTASSNIVSTNQLDGNCDFDFTLFFNAPVTSGNMNKSGDPMFVSVAKGDLRMSTFYRLQAGSEAIDMADGTLTEPVDIDGDPRPAAKDMGADEFVP